MRSYSFETDTASEGSATDKQIDYLRSLGKQIVRLGMRINTQLSLGEEHDGDLLRVLGTEELEQYNRLETLLLRYHGEIVSVLSSPTTKSHASKMIDQTITVQKTVLPAVVDLESGR